MRIQKKPNSSFFSIINSTGIDLFVRLLLFISIIFISYINVFNDKQPILEMHSFRQTQTALTAYYLKSDGFRLAYLTPVIGEPWSVPFEFPIYQQIVAASSSLIGSSLTSLTETGRLINLAFTLLTCIPLYFSLARLNIEKNAIYLSLALYLTSPVYLFWAGTFMIEGSALFFTCSFLYYSITIIQREWINKNFILFSFFLLLALLQKITTPLPVLVVVMLTLSIFTIRLEDFRHNFSSVVKLAFSFLLPILIAYLWVKFSDSVKMQNPIGSKLTSSVLGGWNYGSFDQKLSKQLWVDIIFDRNIKKSSLYNFGLAFVIMAILLIKEKVAKTIIVVSLLLFLLPFLVFTNLHIVHNYYQTANSVFFSIAVGVSVIYICNRFLKNSPTIYGFVLVSFITSNLYWFYKDYLPAKTLQITGDNKTLMISDYIKNHTPINGSVIWYGFDWSSEPAFYSERKSLTVPDWDSFELDAIEKTEKFLQDKPSAIVLCPTKNIDLIRNAINAKYNMANRSIIADCEVYLLDGIK